LCIFSGENDKDEAKEVEDDEFGDLDQLLRIERLREQKRKDEEAFEPEVDETQVENCLCCGGTSINSQKLRTWFSKCFPI